MVVKQAIMNNYGMTEEKATEDFGEFFKCNRCLYDKTIDEFGNVKSGRNINIVKSVEQKINNCRDKSQRKQTTHQHPRT